MIVALIVIIVSRIFVFALFLCALTVTIKHWRQGKLNDAIIFWLATSIANVALQWVTGWEWIYAFCTALFFIACQVAVYFRVRKQLKAAEADWREAEEAYQRLIEHIRENEEAIQAMEMTMEHGSARAKGNQL